MTAVSLPPIMGLHRYYMTANRLRTHFVNLAKPRKYYEVGRIESAEHLEMQLYLTVWYGMLYVVVEGWQQVGFTDAAIDALLASPYTALLKRFRNGVFHYQRNYFDRRFRDFTQNVDTSVWAHKLHLEFARWFRDCIREKRYGWPRRDGS